MLDLAGADEVAAHPAADSVEEVRDVPHRPVEPEGDDPVGDQRVVGVDPEGQAGLSGVGRPDLDPGDLAEHEPPVRRGRSGRERRHGQAGLKALRARRAGLSREPAPRARSRGEGRSPDRGASRAVDHEDRRRRPHPVGAGDTPVGIKDDRRGIAALRNGPRHHGAALGDVRQEKIQTLGAELPGEGRERGQLPRAIGSPGRPEVEQDDATPEIRELDELPGEIGGGRTLAPEWPGRRGPCLLRPKGRRHARFS